jgi:hypothetical protein
LKNSSERLRHHIPSIDATLMQTFSLLGTKICLRYQQMVMPPSSSGSLPTGEDLAAYAS